MKLAHLPVSALATLQKPLARSVISQLAVTRKVAIVGNMSGHAPAVAPTWQDLMQKVLATPTGSKLKAEDDERSAGYGPPHRSSKLRLFGAKSKDEIRVKLYRDSAAWCPYCQKLWIMLEEKQIPYEVELINMRSYGDKPKSFLQKCPRGLLPALELDGQLFTESLNIMAMLDKSFNGPAHRKMLPMETDASWSKMQHLLNLERNLFSAWCGYVFRSGSSGRQQFEQVLQTVEAALGEVKGVPWFMDFTDGPSLVDLQYVSHVERMIASVPYWKGHAIRGNGLYPNIEKWLEAFEQRASYVATKSDWYSHVKDIPPQYGPGMPVEQAMVTQEAMNGGDASWHLPLPPLTTSKAPSDILQPGWEPWEVGAPHEAAYRVATNHGAISRFMARGAGTAGNWSLGRPDRAELADPYAKPAEGVVLDNVDVALRVAVAVLLDGARPTEAHKTILASLGSRSEVRASAEYLRDRVGVPRDMSYPAARCLRGTMNWLTSSL